MKLILSSANIYQVDLLGKHEEFLLIDVRHLPMCCGKYQIVVYVMAREKHYKIASSNNLKKIRALLSFLKRNYSKECFIEMDTNRAGFVSQLRCLIDYFSEKLRYNFRYDRLEGTYVI